MPWRNGLGLSGAKFWMSVFLRVFRILSGWLGGRAHLHILFAPGFDAPRREDADLV